MDETTMHEEELTDAELANLARPLKFLAARVVEAVREFFEPMEELLDDHQWQRLHPNWDDFCASGSANPMTAPGHRGRHGPRDRASGERMVEMMHGFLPSFA